MTTYPLSTLACSIGPTGITSPSLADIILSLQASYEAIYGSDINWDNSSQDAQWIAIQAQAIYDSNQVAIFVYNQFSPATAQGVGLSSVVKINGLQREQSSNSTAPVTFTGQAYSPLVNPIVGDDQNLGTQWITPGTFTIPSGGSFTQTATCTTPGSIAAAANTLTQLINPTTGWQSATNPEAAAVGNPVESDSTLRQRQSVSTNLPAETVLTAIIGNISNLGGVTAVTAFENPTGTTDVNGIPPWSTAFVVIGGNAQDIANTIGAGMAPGPPTYGNTTETYVDPYGIPHPINFSIPTQETIAAAVTVIPLTGYSDGVGVEIIQSMSNYISGLGSGTSLLNTRLIAPALLRGPSTPPLANPNDPNTYELVLPIQASIGTVASGTADIAIAFNQIAVPGSITVVT